MATKLAVVVPCYNEEDVLNETAKQLTALLEKMILEKTVSSDSYVCFVDDGSRDKTWPIIEQLSTQTSLIKGLKLSRNVGHQHALLAGLLTTEGDAIISIDADLQDDISVIENMVKEFHDGAQVVYGARKRRDTDTVFKRKTAQWFYKMLRLLGVEVIDDHADFRLLGRKALDALREFGEFNLFLRGIVPLLGFNSSIVYYDRSERLAGESKYPLPRMLSLAIDGVTSFSVTPLRLISIVGIIVFLFSAFMGLWVLSMSIFTDKALPGWASTVLPIYFIGGIQILAIGVLGEYAGKIYKEVKRRPRYIIEKTVN